MSAAGLRPVLAVLRRGGLLLLADARLPSVTTLVAGEPVAGSWWSHPRGRAIYAVASALEEHRDALAVKLLAGKVTFVHRGLWPALLGVAGERARWQTGGLSAAARALLRIVEREGAVRTDELARWRHATPPGRAAAELERRLLALGQQVHTERGAHALRLLTWAAWREEACPALEPLAPAAGRARLEQAAAALATDADARALLPWT